jgi:hypothetical protein
MKDVYDVQFLAKAAGRVQSSAVPVVMFKRGGSRGGAANIKSASLLLAVLLSAGCASWSGHGVTIAPDGKFRIAVLPVQSEVEVDRLSDVETVPEGRHRASDPA